MVRINDYARSKTEPPEQPPIDLRVADGIVDVLLREGHIIFGSYVLKRVLLGMRPNDIDVVRSTKGDTPFLSDGAWRKIVDIAGNTRVNIDVHDSTPQNDPVFISTVAIQGSDKRFIPATSRVTQAMVDYVVDQVPKKRYCPWDNMRDKDKWFFKDFEIIPEEECELHGFMRNVRGVSNY